MCAICGKRRAKTYRYPFLARYGIKGKYAAQECAGKLPQPDMTNVAVFMPRPVVDPETGEPLGPGA